MDQNILKMSTEFEENKVLDFNLYSPHSTSLCPPNEIIEDECDLKTFEISELNSESKCDQCENIGLSVEVPEKIACIKQELPEEFNENIAVKQEYPDSEEIKEECAIKKEPGIEDCANEEGHSSIWIKQELPDINDHFISENNDYIEESSSLLKQEYNEEHASFINRTGNLCSTESDDDVSFICEIPPAENRDKEVIPNFQHQCPKCQFAANEISVLNQHMHASHTKLKCTWCDFLTFQLEHLKAHVQRVHVQSTYKTINGAPPDELDTITKPKTPLKVKVQIIDIRKSRASDLQQSNECPYCEFVASSPMHLTRHTLIHCNLDSCTQDNFTQYSCANCPFITSQKKVYMAHKTKCLRYKCSENFCRFMTSVREDFWDHIIKEHRNQNNFVEKIKLYKPTYKCNMRFCRFNTRYHADYLRHLEVHKKKNDCIEKCKKYCRSYKCSEDLCDYFTKNREELWDHIIQVHRHEKECKKLKPIYKCAEKHCKFNTNNHKDSLKHIDVLRSATECSGKTRKFGGNFKCSERLCEFTTNFREHLWAHIVEEHRTEKTSEIHVKCHWCCFSSNQTSKLKEHVQNVHVKSTYKSTNIQK